MAPTREQNEAGDGEGPASVELLQRAQAGDRDARDRLMAHYLPRLKRWASGRLPRSVRDLADTTDLVQDTLLNTFRRIETVEAGRDGGLQAYLRQAVMNAIRDEIRRIRRKPRPDPLSSAHPDPGRTPLELAIGQEVVDRYELALKALRPKDREAVVARLELGCSYAEVAELLGSPSPNAARMVVERATLRLAEQMRDVRRSEPDDTGA